VLLSNAIGVSAAGRHHQIPEVSDLHTYEEYIVTINRVSVHDGKQKDDFTPVADGEAMAFKAWATSRLSGK
jgi:hypothetical protein